MNRSKLGFGIIGTGAIALHHAKSIQELEDSKLVAVCSSSEERAKEASIKFGVPAYSNLEEFLRRDDLDIISVCTKSGRHMEPIIAAAMTGKHIIVEKPIEVTLARASRIISVCREQNVRLGVIFQNRFNPAYMRLKQAVREGALGKLILGNAYIKWYRDEAYYKTSDWKGTLEGDGGAALINQGIHTIDLLLDIMGDVESVLGKVKTMVHDIEGEDLGIAMLDFKNGAMGTIEGGTSLYPGYKDRLEIFGENGSVIYEGGKIISWNLKGEAGITNNADQISSSGASNPLAIDYRLHMAQIKDMVLAVRNGRDPQVNGESAIKSLELITAIYTSSREKKEIKLK